MFFMLKKGLQYWDKAVMKNSKILNTKIRWCFQKSIQDRHSSWPVPISLFQSLIKSCLWKIIRHQLHSFSIPNQWLIMIFRWYKWMGSAPNPILGKLGKILGWKKLSQIHCQVWIGSLFWLNKRQKYKPTKMPLESKWNDLKKKLNCQKN